MKIVHGVSNLVQNRLRGFGATVKAAIEYWGEDQEYSKIYDIKKFLLRGQVWDMSA